MADLLVMVTQWAMHALGWMLGLMVLVGLLVSWWRPHPDRGLEAVQRRTFDALVFPVAGNGPAAGQPLTGAQVRVVRRPPPQPTRWTWFVGGHDVEAFWYCVAPDGRCFVAIAHNEMTWWRWQVSWLVLPLDEVRMRGVLAGDDDALALAFGDRREM